MTPKTETPTKTEDEIIADLLANVPSSSDIPIDLPSRNMFYTLIDPAEPVTVRAMTFQDEKAMVSNKAGDIDIINTLLARCVSNVSVGDLLLVDKLFLIMKIREISYGDDYKAVVTCPACKKSSEIIFKLSELGVTYMPEGYTNPVCVHFPTLDKDAKIELPRIKDEKYLVTTESTTNNFWRFLVDVDGYKKKTILSKVAEQLPLKDAHVMLNVLGGDGLGVQTKVQFACEQCPNTEIIDLPITADFFSGS
tara:strand:+ start:4532 stop:5284 length:753 start_codon:yes stop_codon:yes gene_type:complete